MLFEGDDLGKWLERQAGQWAQLSTERQQRLSQLGIEPAEWLSVATAKKSAARVCCESWWPDFWIPWNARAHADVDHVM
ncbi:hypothetical protein DY245_33070, partial [Streptomyces inhibens]